MLIRKNVNNDVSKDSPGFHAVDSGVHSSTRVLTIYMEKPEVSVGKSNGSRHFVWEASENMDCDSRGCNFSTLFSLFS